jgi:hypothetical protein
MRESEGEEGWRERERERERKGEREYNPLVLQVFNCI